MSEESAKEVTAVRRVIPAVFEPRVVEASRSGLIEEDRLSKMLLVVSNVPV